MRRVMFVVCCLLSGLCCSLRVVWRWLCVVCCVVCVVFVRC